MNKRGVNGLSLIIALIIGSLLIFMYFVFVFPKISNAMNFFTIMGGGCKYPGFYYDSISHSEYAYEFYEEYISCNYKEDDETAYLKAFKKLKLKPNGMANLFLSFYNSGNGDLVEKEVGGTSFFEQAKKYARSPYFNDKAEEISNIFESLPAYFIDFKVNLDIQDADWGDCDEQEYGFFRDDAKDIIGKKRSYKLTADTVTCDVSSISLHCEVCEIKHIEFLYWLKFSIRDSDKNRWTGEKVFVIGENDPVISKNAPPYKVTYLGLKEGDKSKTFFYKITLLYDIL